MSFIILVFQTKVLNFVNILALCRLLKFTKQIIETFALYENFLTISIEIKFLQDLQFFFYFLLYPFFLRVEENENQLKWKKNLYWKYFFTRLASHRFLFNLRIKSIFAILTSWMNYLLNFPSALYIWYYLHNKDINGINLFKGRKKLSTLKELD